jgi:signal peptidase II
MKKNSIKWFYLVALLLVVLDQGTKLMIKGFHIGSVEHHGMMYGQLINVIGTFVQIVFVENEGMAFGISFGAGKIFLSLFSIIASIALGIYLYKLKEFSVWVRIGIMLIFTGAIGNLIDRVFYGIIFNEGAMFYGRVVDFIQIDIPDINFLGFHYTHWPVFNVADSCVSCGVVLLLIVHKKIPSFEQVFKKKDIIIDEVDNTIIRNELEHNT